MLWWHSRQKHQTLRAPIFMQPEAVKNSSLVYSHHCTDASYLFSITNAALFFFHSNLVDSLYVAYWLCVCACVCVCACAHTHVSVHAWGGRGWGDAWLVTFDSSKSTRDLHTTCKNLDKSVKTNLYDMRCTTKVYRSLNTVLSHYQMLWWHSRQKHQTLRAPIFMQPEAVKNSSLVYSHHCIDASYTFFN